MADRLISEKAAIDAICKACSVDEDYHKCDGYPETSTWCEQLVALRALPSAQPEQQWIPVKERLPEDRVPILITDSEGDVIKGEYWSDDCWRCFVTAEEFLTIHNPVAWMPSPAPYKEDKE